MTTATAQRLPETYYELVNRLPLAPFESEADFEAAEAMLDELLCRDQLDRGGKAYLSVLGDLIRAYEQEHHPIGDSSEGEMLAFLLDVKGVTVEDAGSATGIDGVKLGEVTRGETSLTKDEIVALARYFHVTPATFLPG